jgi:alanyl aminopeptidase
VRKPLAALGRKYLGAGKGGKIDADAVSPELAPLAVLEAILADPKLLPPTLARFYAEDEENVRSALLGGLAGLDEPNLAAQVRPLSLNARSRVNEVLTPYFEQAADSRTRPGAWADFKKNFDTLAKRLDEEIGTYVPFAAGDPCDDAARPEIEAFFTSKAPLVPGMERGLKQELETIHLCAARKEAQGPSAKSYFTGKK